MPNGSVTGCQFTLPLGSTWLPNWKVLVGTPGCTSSIGMIWVWPLGLPFWDEGTSMIRKPTWENPYDNSDQIGISWLHPWKIEKFEPQKGLVQMMFFFNWVIFRFQNFQGCLFGECFFVPHEPSLILERCLGVYFWKIFTTHKLGERWSYGWWFRNPANQLRLVVEIPLFTGFYTSQVVCLGISEPSTLCWQRVFSNWLLQLQNQSCETSTDAPVKSRMALIPWNYIIYFLFSLRTPTLVLSEFCCTP